MTDLLDQKLEVKINAIAQMLLRTYPCMWGHGVQHTLCVNCDCVCRTFQHVQKKECEFDPAMAEKMMDFKWCGYDQKEMRSMRDFALSRGWKPQPPAPEQGKLCDAVGTDDPCSCKPSEDEIEKKIKDFIDWANSPPTPVWKEKLRELVKLARRGK